LCRADRRQSGDWRSPVVADIKPLGHWAIDWRRWSGAEGEDAAEFGDAGVGADGEAGFTLDARKSLDEKGAGIDKIGENVRRDATGDGVFGEAGEVGIYFGGGTQFAGGAEEIGHVAGVEGLLVEEAAFAVGVEDAEIVVVL